MLEKQKFLVREPSAKMGQIGNYGQTLCVYLSCGIQIQTLSVWDIENNLHRYED